MLLFFKQPTEMLHSQVTESDDESTQQQKRGKYSVEYVQFNETDLCPFFVVGFFHHIITFRHLRMQYFRRLFEKQRHLFLSGFGLQLRYSNRVRIPSQEKNAYGSLA